MDVRKALLTPLDVSTDVEPVCVSFLHRNGQDVHYTLTDTLMHKGQPGLHTDTESCWSYRND